MALPPLFFLRPLKSLLIRVKRRSVSRHFYRNQTCVHVAHYVKAATHTPVNLRRVRWSLGTCAKTEDGLLARDCYMAIAPKTALALGECNF